MGNKHFGTDGIRGRAGAELSAQLALAAASAFTQTLNGVPGGERAARRPLVILGCDSRLSSPMLKAAVQAGLLQGGVDVLDLDIVPTPVVPWQVLKRRAAGGVMITASHNPVPDNGIKFFTARGEKLDSATEARMEELIDAPAAVPATRQFFGELSFAVSEEEYLQFVLKAAGSAKRGLNIVLDCAHGATSALARSAFELAGHTVTVLNEAFDGARVNVKSGATHLEPLGRAVRRHGADCGLAFDGDGDRVLAVDQRGRPVSGDVLIALLATGLPRYKRERAVVMTQMTNLGVELTLAQRGVRMLRTEVGDANVYAALVKEGLHLGGEQSGHIILRDKLPAGDGILVGLTFANLLARGNESLAELAAVYPQYPQKLTNLKVRDKHGWQQDRALQRSLTTIRGGYKDVRFYLRPSGTENLFRVLTESQDREQCDAANAAICEAIHAWDTRA